MDYIVSFSSHYNMRLFSNIFWSINLIFLVYIHPIAEW